MRVHDSNVSAPNEQKDQEPRAKVSKSFYIYGLLLFAILILISGCSDGVQQDTAQIESGRALYSENCQVCHGDAATGENAVPDAPAHGPDGHTWHHADGQLSEIILGELSYPGRTMPSFEGILSQEDVTAILGYFKSNWKSDQLEFQAEASKNWEELNEN